MLFITARFALFRTAVKYQKKEFRQTVLLQNRHEMEKITMKAGDLYRDVQGIEWKESNKELVIKGKYHEVVAIEKNGKEFVVYIIADTRENELFRSFFDNDNNNHFAESITLLLSLTFITPAPVEFDENSAMRINHHLQSSLKSLPGFYCGIEIPPRA
jgi:hypothetical protein